MSEVFIAKEEELSGNARAGRTVGHTGDQKLVSAQESANRVCLTLRERRVRIVAGPLELRADVVAVDDFDFALVDQLRDTIALRNASRCT